MSDAKVALSLPPITHNHQNRADYIYYKFSTPKPINFLFYKPRNSAKPNKPQDKKADENPFLSVIPLRMADPKTVALTSKLKKDLEKLVKEILEEDDPSADKIDEALKILVSLRDSTVPDLLRCPISGELMKDPVVLASGQTFDRPYIQNWLKEGHRLCPKTQQVLSHTFLTSNELVREMVLKWCRKRGIDLPTPDTEGGAITNAQREDLNLLLEKLSSSLPDQKEAAKKLRMLTKKVASFRALFAECTDAISRVLSPLSPGVAEVDPELLEDVITTVLNVSIHDDHNKSMIGDNPNAIRMLVDSLRTGRMETRANAAATLSSLATLENNKLIIGEAKAIKPLILLLEGGNLSGMKDAAGAIFKLCTIKENKSKAVDGGLVKVLVEKIKNQVLVNELVSVLALISGDQRAIEEMVELGFVTCLFGIIKETTCERSLENCVAILFTICLHHHAALEEVRAEENAKRTISYFTQNGTLRTRRKAYGILEKLKVRETLHT